MKVARLTSVLLQLDNLGHHPRLAWLPTEWLCDLLDLRLGVTKTELRRTR